MVAIAGTFQLPPESYKLSCRHAVMTVKCCLYTISRDRALAYSPCTLRSEKEGRLQAQPLSGHIVAIFWQKVTSLQRRDGHYTRNINPFNI